MSFLDTFGNKIDNTIQSVYSGWDKHKIGILSTVIFHLLLLISFLSFKIETRKEYYGSTIEMEFEQEKAEQEIPQPKTILLPLDATNPQYEAEAIKNFAVDASEKDLNPGLTDEKNINADELYKDANRAKEEMQNNKQLFEEAQKDLEGIIPNTPEKNIPEDKKSQYKGPTVVSYYLEGRKAMRLPVPSYKCELGGQVVVNIEVLPDGRVANANIDKINSVTDDCINDAAISAALGSRFTPSNKASRQKGSITYLFVPQ